MRSRVLTWLQCNANQLGITLDNLTDRAFEHLQLSW
jgi:hypothetical protein